MQRVEAAAPDSASVKAAMKLAKPGPWSDVGVSGDLVWGSCQGSGKKPYQVSIDSAGPAYKCSCPSRKFPCKHALALLFLWAQGHINESGEIASFASSWAEDREARAAKAAAKKETAEKPKTPEQIEKQKQAAAARAAQREEWVSQGLADLDRFLADQVREGLAANTADRPQRLQQVAARMVDAQAGAVSNWLHEVSYLPQTDDWPTKLLDEYALLHLLVSGWQRRDELPEPLVQTIRSRIGFITKTEDVLKIPGVRDNWVVIGMVDADEDLVSVRKVWLWGKNTNNRALVLFFSRGREGLDSSLYPGLELDAELHFYPGNLKLRAVVGNKYQEIPRAVNWQLPGEQVSTAISQLRSAIAADPWVAGWPVAVRGNLVHNKKGFWLLAETGLKLSGTETDSWQLLAEAGSAEIVVLGELSSEGLRPLCYLVDGEVRVL
ncbi:MAG: hypothetical protein CR979_02745 [Propionibacterium sp.]|nr:MAG: hypothetical protein CR979_02745 [Propionibacterium sp.]